MQDPTSLAGKHFPLRGSFDVVVAGAGAAGIAAALAAAREGGSVLLVDEHPLDPGLIGMDIPWLFGGRLDAAVQNQSRMEERIVAARPGLLAAMEAGVEVALGTAVWGGFVKGAASRTLAQPMLGLADARGAWLVGFGRLVVATGARDVVVPVPGWTLPGVMGARGFDAALRLYGAFAGQRVAVLGGGALAAGVVAAARAAGLAVVAEVTEPGPLRIEGALEVEGLAWAGGRVACDTVVLAIDVVPNLELPDVLGCAIGWDAERGGFVAQDAPLVTVVGDAAGTAPAMREAWMAAALAAPDAMVCACEEVLAADLRALRPPRYLGAEGPEAGLGALGPLNQDQVKRLTRAGMGACQGRRCRDAVQALLVGPGDASLPHASPRHASPHHASPHHASHRAPLRPLPLAVLAALEEEPALRANWTGWFGIPGQWLPHWAPVPDNPEFIGGRLTAEGGA